MEHDANTIILSKKNDVRIKIDCERSILQELYEDLSFEVPGAKHMPKYKAGVWDGQLHLVNYRSKTTWYGLIKHIVEFANSREYKVILDDSIDKPKEFSLIEAKEFIEDIKLPEKFLTKKEQLDYQIKAFIKGVRYGRGLWLSPTGSGKSLIIYLLIRYHMERVLDQDEKSLIIVPTTTLVHQLYGDFVDYAGQEGKSWAQENLHIIHAGKQKKSNSRIYISTWQSLFKLDPEYFMEFNQVLVDEAHLASGASITKIMECLEYCRHRFGLTGTLNGTKIHRLQLEGMFFPASQLTTTKELIDKKVLSDFRVKAIVLKHNKELVKLANLGQKGLDATKRYKREVDYICELHQRNRFVSNLSLSLNGNTLLLFTYTEHGKTLYNMIKNRVGEDRKVFLVYGNVKGEERNEIRAIVEKETNAIIVASTQTFGTGVNIRNLTNLIFSSPSKARIRVLQSIGRALRRTEHGENKAILFDIADDLSCGKATKNTTLKHFAARMEMYAQEQFEYKIYNVELK